MIWNHVEWKAIPGYEKYYASKEGDILSMKKEEPYLMKQQISKDNHHYVYLYDSCGNSRKVWVHRAVLSAWVRPPRDGEEGRHLNDNPHENTLRNLSWGTRADNVDDKRKNGGFPIGERSGTHKLTESDVREIRKLYGKQSLRSIAKIYGVSHTCIRRAALGIKWSYLKEGEYAKDKNRLVR